MSDLHLGKRLHDFSLLEDQRDILNKIIDVINNKKPDVIILAGDIYDKPVPAAEAVALFDDFLSRLSELGAKTFVISGNHDSAERIAFGARLMDRSGVYVSPVYNGKISPVILEDGYGPVAFYMLPFIRPANVRAVFPDREIDSYTEAVRTAVGAMELSPEKRNVLITHQFVTGAVRSESEDISVGGSDNVDASVFEGFDYVALGHIHRAQSVSRDTIRYAGTPLSYSFSEAGQEKSVTIVDLYEKGRYEISRESLTPLHALRRLRGSYDELTFKGNYENTATDDYLHIVLTDEEDVFDALARLRSIYPNICKLDYDNTRTRAALEALPEENPDQKTALELFMDFYEKQNGKEMSCEQRELSRTLIEKLKEEMI